MEAGGEMVAVGKTSRHSIRWCKGLASLLILHSSSQVFLNYIWRYFNNLFKIVLSSYIKIIKIDYRCWYINLKLYISQSKIIAVASGIVYERRINVHGA